MRKANVHRKTRETDISVQLNLDGHGDNHIKTPISFLNHMLTLLSNHSLIDMDVRASGDIEVDQHHTVEDLGIVIGNALKKALGDKSGIRRWGSGSAPMDEALVDVSLDISGRSYLAYNVKFGPPYRRSEFNYDLVEEFFQAFCRSAEITLHILKRSGRNNHHLCESLFKSFALALGQAIEKRPRRKSVPSTKGSI